MKQVSLLLIGLLSAAAHGQALLVPAELLGTSATRKAECTRTGPTTLTISQSTVVRHNARGSIVNGWASAQKGIEVLFDPVSTGPHAPGVRTYSLSLDGDKLLELRGGTIVERRSRCPAPPTPGFRAERRPDNSP